MEKLLPLDVDDLHDAFDHIEDFVDDSYSEDDFAVTNPSLIPIKELERYDDLFGWVEFEPGELVELDAQDALAELTSYRGSEWASRAMEWNVPKDMPPIVIFDSDVMGISTIGDGRGRVNYAVAMGWPTIPAVFVTDKLI